MRAAILSILLGLSLSSTLRSEQVQPLRVGVATNFRSAAELISERFSDQTDIQVSLSSASTGALYSQIVYGAPFDVLLAADSERPTMLVANGQALGDSLVTYAVGKLVLAYQEPLSGLAKQGIKAVLGEPGITLAIANPELAPYGRAAMKVLERYPLDESSRLLQGANIGQAFQMWHSGGADAALVAASYRPDNYLPLPDSWYPPIRQQAVILAATNHPGAARQYIDYLRSRDSRSLIESLGYGAGDGAAGADDD